MPVAWRSIAFKPSIGSACRGVRDSCLHAVWVLWDDDYHRVLGRLGTSTSGEVGRERKWVLCACYGMSIDAVWVLWDE